MHPRLNIAVMLGGPGAEREVSLRSGAGVANALRSLGHRVHEVDPRDGTFELPAGTDVVFLALHGIYGEDGTVQEQLDSMGIPYTGCDAGVSRIAFDKVQTKRRCIDAGVPTARYVVVNEAGAPFPPGWNPPVVVKPVRQGSSVGMHFVDSVEDWAGALRSALEHDSEVIVEERINGRETTVGILGGRVLPIVEVRPRIGVYNYANKYTPGCTDYFCPASFTPDVTRQIQSAALRAFQAVGGGDYARVDAMVREDDPVVLEVNTLPGMTETSLFPKAAAAGGIDYPQLCEMMVEMALRRRAAAGLRQT